MLLAQPLTLEVIAALLREALLIEMPSKRTALAAAELVRAIEAGPDVVLPAPAATTRYRAPKRKSRC